MKPLGSVPAAHTVMVLAAALLVAGCAAAPTAAGNGTPGAGTASPGAAAAGPALPASQPPVTVRMVLPARVIVTGAAVTARFVISNRTGHALRVTDCDGNLFQVQLWAGNYRPGTGWLACLGFDVIPAGQSARTARFMASWGGCATTRARPPGLLGCPPDGRIAPLPPGTYAATPFEDGTVLPVPGPVTVRLVAPAR
jgi:hypothetical protein